MKIFKDQRGFGLVPVILIGVLAIGVVGYVSYTAWQANEDGKNRPTQQTNNTNQNNVAVEKVSYSGNNPVIVLEDTAALTDTNNVLVAGQVYQKLFLEGSGTVSYVEWGDSPTNLTKKTEEARQSEIGFVADGDYIGLQGVMIKYSEMSPGKQYYYRVVVKHDNNTYYSGLGSFSAVK